MSATCQREFLMYFGLEASRWNIQRLGTCCLYNAFGWTWCALGHDPKFCHQEEFGTDSCEITTAMIRSRLERCSFRIRYIRFLSSPIGKLRIDQNSASANYCQKHGKNKDQNSGSIAIPFLSQGTWHPNTFQPSSNSEERPKPAESKTVRGAAWPAGFFGHALWLQKIPDRSTFFFFIFLDLRGVPGGTPTYRWQFWFGKVMKRDEKNID